MTVYFSTYLLNHLKNKNTKKSLKKNIVSAKPILGSYSRCNRPCCNLVCEAKPRLNVDFLSYDPGKKFRSCAQKYDAPLMMELFNYNLISPELMTVRHLWTLFIDYVPRDDGSFSLFGYYNGNFDTFEVNGRKQNIMSSLKLFYREIKKIARLVRRQKLIFFKEALIKLKRASKIKGTVSGLYKRLSQYVIKLSVFGYDLNPEFIYYSVIFFKKCKIKRWYSFNQEGEFLKLKTKGLFIRDFKQFVANDTYGKDIEKINLENKRHLKPGEDFLVQLTVLYFDVTGWLWSNFPGFFLEAEDHVSLASIGFQLSLFFHGNPLNMAQLRMSPDTLEQFHLKSQGGLVFNTTFRCKSGEPLRPALNRMNPVKSLHLYDIQGAYGGALKSSNSIPCGHLLHYVSTDEKYSDNLVLERVTDSFPFAQERDITFNIIYCHMNNPEYEIVSVYHSFNHRNQFFMNKYSLDLTLILRLKETRTEDVDKRYGIGGKSVLIRMFLIDGIYWHGPCDLGCQDDNFRYANGANGQDLAKESERKFLEIKKLATSIFGSRVEVLRIFPCHFKTVDPFTGLVYNGVKEFYKNCQHPLIKPFRLYQNIKKKIRFYKDVMNDLNCFITAKVTLPKNPTFGFVIGKFCLKCYDPTLSENHHLRLAATNKSQQYSIFSGSQLNFLVEECQAEIDSVTHVWRFMPSPDYKPYIHKMLKLRIECQKEGYNTLKKMCKNIINAGIGYWQIKSDRHRTKSYFSYKSIPRGMASSILSVSTLDGNGKYLKYLSTRRKYTSWLRYYFGQSLLGVGHAVLQESKLILLKVFLCFDKYMDKEKFNLLYVNTDSSLVACTENSVIECVYPDKADKFKREVYSGLFFDPGNSLDDSTGRMILEKSFYGHFEFTSSSPRNYQIITLPSPEEEEGRETTSHVRGIKSLVNTLRIDRKSLVDGDSVPF